MVGLQRLGARTAYAGRFGNDAAGTFGIESLRTEGIDISFTQEVPGAQTQIAFILIDERSGERTVIWKRDAKLSYSREDIPLEIVERASVLHLTPHDTQACLMLARRAKEIGTVVSIDLDNTFPGLEDLLPYVDILITSAELPKRMLGIDGHREGIAAMQTRFGSPVIGITLGESGSLLRCAGQFVETSGFPVPGGCKDTTGAGDSFRAGFLHGLINRASVEESARIANAVASLNCRATGARTALPTPSELDSLLEKNI
jgi:sugar/nucleoside kinase (ribokinase family)